MVFHDRGVGEPYSFLETVEKSDIAWYLPGIERLILGSCCHIVIPRHPLVPKISSKTQNGKDSYMNLTVKGRILLKN
jgi:hypothetical protein